MATKFYTSLSSNLQSQSANAEMGSTNTGPEVTNPKGSKMTFPNKLMQILSSPFFADCISWTKDGKAFYFLDRDKFTKKLISISPYKKEQKKNSFTRKLNRWGFKMEWKYGPAYGMYTHELFQRDKPWLCHMIVCEGSGNSSKQQSNQDAMSAEKSQKKRKASSEHDEITCEENKTQDRSAKKGKISHPLEQHVDNKDASSLSVILENLVSIEYKLLLTEILIVEKMKKMNSLGLSTPPSDNIGQLFL